MQSLSDLLAAAGDDNPLRPYLEAIVDSGMIVTLRDGNGIFLTASPAIARVLRGDDGLEESVGRSFIEGQRIFDEDGRETVPTDHPAQVARRTGVPQRQRVMGIRSVNGTEAWVRISYMPLEATSEGWAVIGIGTVLPEGFRSPFDRTGDYSPYAEALLKFAVEAAGSRLSRDELAAAMRMPVKANTSAPISVTLMERRGDMGLLSAITRYVHTPLPTEFTLNAEAIERWDRDATVYLNDMRPSAPVGSRTAADYLTPLRSLAVVPIRHGTEHVAALVVSSTEARALSLEQIAALEALARLAGPMLVPAP